MCNPVADRQAVLERIESLKPELDKLGVVRLGLFGSFSRDEQDEGSDVDVLVEFAPGGKNLTRFLTLGDLLEEVLGRPIDLVTPEALSPYLGPAILAEVDYAAL